MRRTSGRRLDGLVYFDGILDCAAREWVGWNIRQRNNVKEAAWALEDALIRRFGVLPGYDIGVVLRPHESALSRPLRRDLAVVFADTAPTLEIGERNS